MQTIKAFNTAYYNSQQKKCIRKTVPYDPFFYPLDAIYQWNRMYGKHGFFQYQCIVPYRDGYEVMKELLSGLAIRSRLVPLSIENVWRCTLTRHALISTTWSDIGAGLC